MIRTVGTRLCVGGLRVLGVLILLATAGCDQESRSIESRRERGEVGILGIDGHGPGEHAAPTIRVLLLSGTEVRIKSEGQSCGLWELRDSEELMELREGVEYVLSRDEEDWQITGEPARGSSEMVLLTAVGPLELRPRGSGELGQVSTNRMAKSIAAVGGVAGADVKAEDKARPPILSVGTDKLAGYRGKLRFIAGPDGSVRVVNVLDVETYLAGVVSCEVYASWYMAALRAQSIASRTYALWQVQHRGGRGDWDIGSDQGSQVYGGFGREHPRVTTAVLETRGVVLTFGQEGNEKIFPAYYSSTCGGHTQDAKPVFGESLQPLRGRSCPHCAKVARPGLYRWESVTIDKETLSEALIGRYPSLVSLESISNVNVSQWSRYGRAEQLTVTGSNGRSQQIKAQEFRLAVTRPKQPLRSSWYRLVDIGESWLFYDGHGWGHGVGLCQCGAQGMAEQGCDSVTILAYYYPGARLLRAY